MWPDKLSPLFKQSSPPTDESTRSNTPQSWLSSRSTGRSTSSSDLDATPDPGRPRGHSLHAMSECIGQKAQGLQITSPLVPPLLPAAFAHLAPRLLIPASLPNAPDLDSPLVPPPQMPLRQEFSTASLKNFFIQRLRPSATSRAAETLDPKDTFSRVRKFVQSEQDKEAKAEAKLKGKASKETDSRAAEEAERTTNIKVGQKFIARSTTHGWITKKPLCELTDNELSMIGLAVMEKKPKKDSQAQGLQDLFHFAGMDRAKTDYAAALEAHAVKAREARVSAVVAASKICPSPADPFIQKRTGSAAHGEGDAEERVFDPARDIKVTKTVQTQTRRLSSFQLYNSTLAMLEGKSLQEVNAAASREAPDPDPLARTADERTYSDMLDEFTEPYARVVLPRDAASIAGQPPEEIEKTLHKLAGDYSYDKGKGKEPIRGLGISYNEEMEALRAGGVAGHVELRQDDECIPSYPETFTEETSDSNASFSVPSASDSHTDDESVYSQGSDSGRPSPQLVPRPLNVRPSMVPDPDVSSPLFPDAGEWPFNVPSLMVPDTKQASLLLPHAGKRLVVQRDITQHDRHTGNQGFVPVQDDSFYRKVQAQCRKRVEALQGSATMHPAYRPMARDQESAPLRGTLSHSVLHCTAQAQGSTPLRGTFSHSALRKETGQVEGATSPLVMIAQVPPFVASPPHTGGAYFPSLSSDRVTPAQVIARFNNTVSQHGSLAQDHYTSDAARLCIPPRRPAPLPPTLPLTRRVVSGNTPRVHFGPPPTAPPTGPLPPFPSAMRGGAARARFTDSLMGQQPQHSDFTPTASSQGRARVHFADRYDGPPSQSPTPTPAPRDSSTAAAQVHHADMSRNRPSTKLESTTRGLLEPRPSNTVQEQLPRRSFNTSTPLGRPASRIPVRAGTLSPSTLMRLPPRRGTGLDPRSILENAGILTTDEDWSSMDTTGATIDSSTRRESSSPVPHSFGEVRRHYPRIHSPYRGSVQSRSASPVDTDDAESSDSDCTIRGPQQETTSINMASVPQPLNVRIASNASEAPLPTSAMVSSETPPCGDCGEVAVQRCSHCSAFMCTACSVMCEETVCLNIVCEECGAIGLCPRHVLARFDF